MIECIEGFRANLEFYVFGHGKIVLQGQVEGLPAGTKEIISRFRRAD
jgi:hypothetical protein